MIQSKLLSRYSSIDHVFLGRSSKRQSSKHADYLTTAASAEQVHGNIIAIASQFAKRYDAVDGLVTNKSGGSLLIRTADCLPVLLFDPSQNLIAAIHAGWKGLHQNILGSAITALCGLGGTTKHITAVIGPHIGNCCYSVTAERVEQFVQKGLKRKQITRQSGALLYLNLTTIARQQLQEAGISSGQIEAVDVCTHCDERFYSYRRDGQDAGRNFSVIALH